MNNKYLFLVRGTPESPSPGGASEWVLVCESPIPAPILPPALNLKPSCQRETSYSAPSVQVSLATPNSWLQARAWPLLGPRVIRPSKTRLLKGRSSLGMSSFLRGNKTR